MTKMFVSMLITIFLAVPVFAQDEEADHLKAERAVVCPSQLRGEGNNL